MILVRFPQLTANDVRSTSMGVSGRDVQLSEAALRMFPYSIECKSRNRIAVYKDYEQAVSNAQQEVPLLVIKQNGSKPLAVMDLEHFMEIVSGRIQSN